ncbi:MAG: hypothetical protein BMS9Abin20_1220 [Acidimicrobiia bacterium]|nr:MAG: hypothetical protein BMS9Abin20_1220 [Acidimicrobiia bacterium]
MARFMMVYKGEATDMADMTNEEAVEIMGKWAEWMGGIGEALTDIGAPFGPGASLVDDGSSGTAVSLTGYSILEAADMAAAQALADDHPFLSEGKGDYSIDMYELMPVPVG